MSPPWRVIAIRAEGTSCVRAEGELEAKGLYAAFQSLRGVTYIAIQRRDFTDWSWRDRQVLQL
jgi:hypothetical protein